MGFNLGFKGLMETGTQNQNDDVNDDKVSDGRR